MCGGMGSTAHGGGMGAWNNSASRSWARPIVGSRRGGVAQPGHDLAGAAGTERVMAKLGDRLFDVAEGVQADAVNLVRVERERGARADAARVGRYAAGQVQQASPLGRP
jgi:hypothetical protein